VGQPDVNRATDGTQQARRQLREDLDAFARLAAELDQAATHVHPIVPVDAAGDPGTRQASPSTGVSPRSPSWRAVPPHWASFNLKSQVKGLV
jgi:hypothetical protein